MKIGLIGFGKMGQALAKIAPKKGHALSAILSRSLPKPPPETLQEIDLLYDFSTFEALDENLQLAAQLKKPLLIGTTGGRIDPHTLNQFAEKHGIPVFYAANFSVGVQLFFRLATEANRLLKKDFEKALIEEHQKTKKDIPSGSALHLKSLLGDESLNIQSLRLGDALPSHTLLFDNGLERISLTHSAKSRDTYAEGALLAGEWLVGRVGFFTMKELLDDHLA